MEKDISIIIPIHNDADVLANTVDRVLDFFVKEKLLGELIIVNDGGTIAGVEIAQKKQAENISIIQFINRPKNKGKGFTLREGIEKSVGRAVFYMDADLPYGMAVIKQMYDKINIEKFDLVLANRNLSGKKGMQEAPFIRKIAHFVYSVIVGPLVKDVTDPAAGLKGMTRQVAKELIPQLTIDRFAFDIEFIFLANKKGLRISQIPVTLQQTGKSKNLSVITDSPQMIKDILKIVWRSKMGFYNKL